MFENELQELTKISAELLQNCKKTAADGTVIFTPDGVGNYDALWVRDMGYMFEYCGDLLMPEEMERCIRFVLARQREDGWLPDRVEASGEAVYAAGAKGAPVGQANLDNTPFAVFAVTSYFRHVDREQACMKFLEWKEILNRGLACIPLSASGLVYNDPSNPHSPYGFTDTVCKTGELFFESLLYWRACVQMLELLREFSPKDSIISHYEAQAQQIEKNISALYNPQTGLFDAATEICRQPDIWGNAYLLSIGFPAAEDQKQTIHRYLVSHLNDYSKWGQICHTPFGEPWEKLLIDVAPGEYQNGAYWATASGWVLEALVYSSPTLAKDFLGKLLDYFRTEGMFECVNSGYQKLPEFVVSGVNVRGAVLHLSQEMSRIFPKEEKNE